MSLKKWVVQSVGFSIGMTVTAWSFLCAICSFALVKAVPLTSQDYRDASWRITDYSFPYSEEIGFYGLVAALVFTCFEVWRKKMSLPATGLLFILVCSVYFAMSKDVIFRAGLYTEVVKVGCFVYESKECHTMLGKEVSYAPSMFHNERDGKLSVWYSNKMLDYAYENGKKLELESYVRYPGWLFFQTPFALMNAQALNEKIKKQRETVAAFKNSK